MEYKLIVVTNFKDIHTAEEYTAGQELNVSEERAFELFSSQYHLVKFVSREGNVNLESIKAENEALKAENETLKTDVETLKTENEKLVKSSESEDKDKNKNTSNK